MWSFAARATWTRAALIGRVAVAHLVERGFHVVGEVGDAVEAEHRARALDRVQGAEGGVDQVRVVRRAVQVQQGLFQLLQQLRGFLAEDLGGIGAAHAPSTLRTTASNWSC